MYMFPKGELDEFDVSVAVCDDLNVSVNGVDWRIRQCFRHQNQYQCGIHNLAAPLSVFG
jgi:hypothetical protein